MINHRSHYIKRNKGISFPRNMIFFDTETFEEKIDKEETQLKFKLGSYCYVRFNLHNNSFNNKVKYHEINNPKIFWEEVTNITGNKSVLYCVAHNISFDFRVLDGFRILKQLGYKNTKLIINGVTNIYLFVKEDKKIYFLDNMNFFITSLEKLGESIGISKMKMPIETDYPDVREYLDKLMTYCKNDVYILVKTWELYLGFLLENNLGIFAVSIAGQSFNAFRHRFMYHDILVHNLSNEIETERASYHGGRTECFKLGDFSGEEITILDVNSMYPSVMKNNKYPTKILKLYFNVEKDILKILIKKYLVVATVLIKTDVNCIPFYDTDKNKLLFPTGKFETTLCTPEIELAFKYCDILEVKKVICYEGEPIFNEYVDFFYSKKVKYKQENNEAFSYLCKLFLNSLYGKFGQRNEKYELKGETEEEDGAFSIFNIDLNIVEKYRIIEGIMYVSNGELYEGFNSIVAIASHVTSYARVKLFELFLKAGKENVYYCDTDSVFVNNIGRNNLTSIIDNDLGNLSCKKTSFNFILHGIKDYSIDNEITLKGIRKNAEKTGDNRYKQDRFEGLTGAIRKGRTDKMVISKIEKELNRNYDKGIVHEDGTITPIILT